MVRAQGQGSFWGNGLNAFLCQVMEEEIDESQATLLPQRIATVRPAKDTVYAFMGRWRGGTGRSLQGGNAMSHQLANDVSDILFDLDPAPGRASTSSWMMSTMMDDPLHSSQARASGFVQVDGGGGRMVDDDFLIYAFQKKIGLQQHFFMQIHECVDCLVLWRSETPGKRGRRMTGVCPAL